jgi:hypothetical protein
MPFRCKREAVSLADVSDVADFLHFFFVVSEIISIFAIVVYHNLPKQKILN